MSPFKERGDLGAREWALVPVGEARLDDDRDDVIVNFQAADLAGVPAYERGRSFKPRRSSARLISDVGVRERWIEHHSMARRCAEMLEERSRPEPTPDDSGTPTPGATTPGGNAGGDANPVSRLLR